MINFDKKRVAAAVSGIFDRKVVFGIAIGAVVMTAGYVIAEDFGGSPLALPSSEQVSEQAAVVEENILAQAKDCAEAKEGSLGEAIKNALDIHLTMAGSGGDTESLFDINSNCFSSLSQIADLSVFIQGGLSSIINAAASAVMQYAQKKICTAVNEVSSMVTSPINDAIGKINQITNNGNLSGLSAGLTNQVLTQIDASFVNAGSSSGGTYSAGNPFSSGQTDFGGSGMDAGASGNSGQINDMNSIINSLNQQLGNTQAQVGPAQVALQQAQQQLNNCLSSEYGNCTSYQQAVTNAQTFLNGLYSQIDTYTQQLAAVTNSYNSQSVNPTSASLPTSGTSGASKSGGILDSIGNLFN